MLTTRFTQLVGCTVPLQQAAIGGLSNPRLVAAVVEFQRRELISRH